MYAPSIFSNDLYSLWNPKPTSGRKLDPSPSLGTIHNRQAATHEPPTSASDIIDLQRKQLRQLFAPPLVAYSPDYYGANMDYMEYTMQAAASHFVAANPDVGVEGMLSQVEELLAISPLMQLKIDRIESIRNTGYEVLRPIGIGKTLQELDMEAARELDTKTMEDESAVTIAADNTQGNNLNENTQEQGDGGVDVDLDRQVIDLDEQVLDADISHNLDNDSASSEFEGSSFRREQFHAAHIPQLLTFRGDLIDEGFMADEVEYQADHSLDASLHHHEGLMLSSGSSSLSTAIPSGVISGQSARSLSTNMTSAHSYTGILDCIGEDAPIASDIEYSSGLTPGSGRIFSGPRMAAIPDENEENDHSGINDSDMIMD